MCANLKNVFVTAIQRFSFWMFGDRIFVSLDCGIVGVNDGIISTCNAPFGGIKESGMGREGSPLGMSEYLETKYIFMNV